MVFFRFKPLPTNSFFLGSGALPGEMLLGRIIANNKIDAYFRYISLCKG